MNETLLRISTLLEQGTVSANFQVGRLLTSMQANAGPTHGKDFIGQVSMELKKHGGGGAASVNHLLKCRKLSEEWTEDFVVAVQERSVPWHAVLKALFACSQTKSLGDSTRKSVVKTIRAHLLRFPKTRRGSAVKVWLESLAKIKNGFATKLDAGGKQKQLFEASEAINVKLRDARGRLKNVRKLLTPALSTTLDDVVERLNKVATDATAVIQARLKELRSEPAQSNSRN